MIRIINLAVPPQQDEQAALQLALKKLRLTPDQVLSFRISKKSLDARDKTRIRIIYSLDLKLKEDENRILQRFAAQGVSKVEESTRIQIPKVTRPIRTAVIGLGPCGLFAALYLARAGFAPLVLERGLPIAQRGRSVNALMGQGILDSESNYQFGEGGAGAFSDGKLTTGIKDPLIRDVLAILVEHGAPEEILFLQRPHIGTDKLPKVVSSIRREIENLGGTVLFGARMTGLRFDAGSLQGIEYVQGNEKKELACQAVITAIGHSARETQRILFDQGLKLIPKSFSIGLRIEHNQAMINQSQYGSLAGKGLLPSAEYHLAHRLKSGRGAYTFCMCPGGRVLPAASEPGGVCVNGMSNYRRDGQNANAALLVEVRPEDYLKDNDPLSGFEFQRKYEQLAFQSGGGGYHAPYQLAGDFMKGSKSTGFGSVLPSYRPGVRSADLSLVLPEFAAEGIKEAILAFDRQLKGFAAPDAVLTGVETRSSCPVQTERNEYYQSNLPGVFPAGEGAGRAGGIMSAAVDGMRTAKALAERTGKGRL